MEVNRTMGKLKQARQAERGQAICAGCPVAVECAAWVASHAEDPCPWHVVAGLAPLERLEARVNNIGRSVVSGCGTEAGWGRHWRRDGGLVMCEACTQARRQSLDARKRNRGAA
jgi:hypothetical protein